LSKKENKHYIDLLCPTCDHENTVHLSSNIKCKECNKTLIGYTYEAFILPVLAVMGLSAIGGAMIDDTLNLNRASVKTEYKMMRTCINRFGHRDNCFCAVESMSGFLDAEKARFYSRSKLSNILQNKYNDCVD
jgi:phage FluMu protein Com